LRSSSDVSPFAARADGVRVRLKVTPRARRDAIDGVAAGADGPALKVSVTAPADEGRANDAVIALLARAWRVPKGAVAVIQGATSRRKLVHVAGDAKDLLPRLDAWLKQG
jgi:uncharacterized protein (TIGR00251 family)